LKPRILTTNIDLDDGTCSLALVEDAADYFGLSPAQARATLKSTAEAVRGWRGVAEGAGQQLPRSDE
jgi:serine/threonine-protein kinase HipA